MMCGKRNCTIIKSVDVTRIRLAINDFLYFIDNAIGVDSDLLSEVFLRTDLDAVEIIDADSVELCAGAERFALAKGGRSPRCAKQYVESLFC